MAGSIRLVDFKAQIQDVARPNRFWVTCGAVQGALAWNDSPMSFAAKSASLPNRAIGDVTLNWQGMKAKFTGDPTFDDITFTFLNTYDWSVRDFFESWMQLIASMDTNSRAEKGVYETAIQLDQLGRNEGEILASYVLDGAFPVALAPIDLNQETSDGHEEFTVTIRFDQFYRVDPSGSGISPQAQSSGA